MFFPTADEQQADVDVDDNEREWGTQDWESKSEDYKSKGYIPISMKNDFTVIYPEGITKASQQYTPAEEANKAA